MRLRCKSSQDMNGNRFVADTHPIPTIPLLTHIALRVKNIEESAAFYKRYAQLELVAQRKENKTRVAWLGNPQVKNTFVIVLLEMPYHGSEQPSYDHLGLDVPTREEVNAVAAMAKQEGILSLEPQELGPVAGYLCMVRDPDGNQVEFSCGQMINPVLHHEKPKEKP